MNSEFLSTTTKKMMMMMMWRLNSWIYPIRVSMYLCMFIQANNSFSNNNNKIFLNNTWTKLSFFLGMHECSLLLSSPSSSSKSIKNTFNAYNDNIVNWLIFTWWIEMFCIEKKIKYTFSSCLIARIKLISYIYSSKSSYVNKFDGQL